MRGIGGSRTKMALDLRIRTTRTLMPRTRTMRRAAKKCPVKPVSAANIAKVKDTAAEIEKS
jgi:hypothetical protein